MNCKPGDIAISISRINGGRLCEILYAAPIGRSIKLPNGRYNTAATEPAWVVKMLDGPCGATLTNGVTVYEWYGCGKDRLLRPLSDPNAEIECCESTSGAGGA